MKHIYSFVDESGQHTLGKLFVVSVVSIEDDLESITAVIENIEKRSGKDKLKWGKARHKNRMKYMRAIFKSTELEGRIFFEVHHNTRQYDLATAQTIAESLEISSPKAGKFTHAIFVDALSIKKGKQYQALVKKKGHPVKYVKGIRKDENNALIRLADALSGFILDAIEQDEGEIHTLYQSVVDKGILVRLK